METSPGTVELVGGMPGEGVRISELAGRTGVSTHVLRVWERRYGLLRPIRSVGGFRLYSPDDERRVHAVVALRAAGVGPGEATRRVLAAERAGDPPSIAQVEGPDGLAGTPTLAIPAPDALVNDLLRATEGLDEGATAHVLDLALARMSVESVVTEVVFPFLTALGEAWAAGRLSVAHEHFGSAVVRRRLGTLSQTWGVGNGPLVVLACPPGELHDIGPLAFGVLLARAGWTVRFLGADTPLPDLVQVADLLRPDLVVLAATSADRYADNRDGVAELARRAPLALAGRGATVQIATAVGATLLPAEPVSAVRAAGRVTAQTAERRSTPSPVRSDEPSAAPASAPASTPVSAPAAAPAAGLGS